MEISSLSGLNPSSDISNHFGINVAQIKTGLLNFDINALTCNSSVTVNKLLSNISPSAQAQCSLVDAIVTVPKTEILCAYSKCIEMELSSSLKVGTIKLPKTTGIQSNVNSVISTQGHLNIKIVDKPKKKP